MLQLTDICTAPLEAAYKSLRLQNENEHKYIVEKHFQVVQNNNPHVVKKYGGVRRTLRPIDNAIQLRNKHGILNEITGPTVAFDQLTTLNVKELMVDFDVAISDIRRHTDDGTLVVDAALPCKSSGGSEGRTGGFHFNVMYKNELPPGMKKLQGIFSDSLDDQYAAIRDSEDMTSESKAADRLLHDKAVDKACKQIEYVLDMLHADARDNALVVRGLLDIRAALSGLKTVPKRVNDLLRKLPSIDELVEKRVVIGTDETEFEPGTLAIRVAEAEDMFTGMSVLAADGTWDKEAADGEHTYIAAPVVEPDAE